MNSQYPEDLKNKEQKAIDQKRNTLNQDLQKPSVGVALSGGGVRSSTQSLGAFQALQEKGLDKEIEAKKRLESELTRKY